VCAAQHLAAQEILAVHALRLMKNDELDAAVGVRVHLFDLESVEFGACGRCDQRKRRQGEPTWKKR
jgi:hypothetical protein